jgi:phenylpyruvate tautomerase PptA (4-oxalocrotonate tautomerase family)
MNAAPAALTVEGVDVREKTVPIYQCSSPEGLLDESARGKLAEEITRIHCDATGVPPSYVNVIFTDVPDGQPEDELIISLWENQAENAMEAGSIFPAVGPE